MLRLDDEGLRPPQAASAGTRASLAGRPARRRAAPRGRSSIAVLALDARQRVEMCTCTCR